MAKTSKPRPARLQFQTFGSYIARMARRLAESVIRGEIDNRRKGVVQGLIWLEGRDQPMILELTGNACADIAGCLLKFTNRCPAVPLHQELDTNPRQTGRIGDLTASRRIRVPEFPDDELHGIEKHGQTASETRANVLYLEWFSETDGRVVIESADFTLELSPPAWQPTGEDEQQRLADAQAAWKGFLERLDARVERHQRGAKDPEEDWDELDYERFFRISDARNDKYGELLDKYGHSKEAHELIDQEMGWNRDLTAEEAEEDQRRIDEINADCEAALETVATKRRRPEDQKPLLPNSLVDEARQELFAVREGILGLMQELRGMV